ncbi:hypothetical protein ACEXQB_006545 [Herbiconiux sp. P18]|uniref:hypothetical protein n=1 Tax=Herbiconiux liangxiaofengii TaxID=3342795 RepID=UPI0035BB0B47
MSESTATLDSTIAEFAPAVRRHLDDLPLDEVDDLTGGLEADLSEQASDEQGDLHLDDPASHASELRIRWPPDPQQFHPAATLSWTRRRIRRHHPAR